MFGFIKNVLDTSAKESDGFDRNLIASLTGIKSSFAEPMRLKRDLKVTRALSTKAARMKLARILEKTEKRR